MERVVVTGAAGFVGSALSSLLSQEGFAVRAVMRRPVSLSQPLDTTIVDTIGAQTSWDQVLSGAHAVVHLAAAHHMPASRLNTRVLMETNAYGTAALARAAARAGVRRFLYMSTVKVNGEKTDGSAFSSSDEPRPKTTYGKSKWLGERAVLQESTGSDMEPIILRAPLVYGPDVRANFLRLLRWIKAGKALPLGAIENQRSLVSIWNLTDLIMHLLRHSAARGIWMVSDGSDLSTPELIRRLSGAMGKTARLIDVPVWALRSIGALVGRSQQVHSLCDSLRVDSSPARQQLGWSPPASIDDALERTVHWYITQGSAGEH